MEIVCFRKAKCNEFLSIASSLKDKVIFPVRY